MNLSGYIYDNISGQGIPFATVMITDNEGDSLKDGTVANGYGFFDIDSPLLDGQGWLYVSSTGYQPVLVNPGVFQESGDIGMDRSGDLVPVVVTATQKKENNWMIFLLAGGGLALLLAEGKRKRKVSGIPTLSQNQWIDIGLKIGIPLAVFFLVVKPLLVWLNILPDQQEQAQTASDEQATNEQKSLGTYSSSDNHTYSQATLDGIAVALRNATKDWMGYNWPEVAKQIAYFTGFTRADARYLLGTFVKKNGYTLYQWYFNEFDNAYILAPFVWEVVYYEPHWYDITTAPAHDYRGNFAKLGITEDNANTFNWPVVINKFVTYVYTVAGVSKQ